ncbi:GNAT family N-acetyltransferase [Neptunicoccus cionae]|uniref:Alanine acetyltransferase n=1 Tax=Neptunicoccus cionae TaxID=2035344 RepID=A0A916QZS4_9RHOB|nr:GNAT family N-acetyltransferase [Amylibacter cionae]GGA23670.1 alanine acetyltransferase [Amylibacter cionae]
MAEIHAACFTQPRPWSTAELTDLCASPLCLVKTLDQGFAIVRRAGPEAELLTIAVHPDARRQGKARVLLTGLLAELHSTGCEEIFLEVVEDNAPAIALYKATGFAALSFRKDYYNGPNGKKSSALVMHKTL